MIEEQEGTQESDGNENPVVDGREDAENVSEVLKESAKTRSRPGDE